MRWLTLVLLAAACGRGAPPAAAPASPAAGDAADSDGRRPASTAAHAVADSVASLRAAGGEPLVEVAGALRSVGALTRALGPRAQEAASLIEEHAGEVERGTGTMPEVTRALVEALDAAVAAAPRLEHEPTMLEARRAVAVLDGGEVHATRLSVVAAAVCATGGAVALATGLDPGAAGLAACELRPRADTNPAAGLAFVDELRATVERLSRATWEDAVTTTALLLETLAAGFAAAGLPAEHATSVREHAETLRELDRLSLDRTKHIKEGLATAVVALGELESLGRPLEAWIASAERAVGGIEASVPLGLQRAPVQDAARAVVDAFAAAAALGSASTPRPAPGPSSSAE